MGFKSQKNNKNKEAKRKLVEEAAERLAQILILQVELSRSKENTTMLSQQNDDRNQKFKKMPKSKYARKNNLEK